MGGSSFTPSTTISDILAKKNSFSKEYGKMTLADLQKKYGGTAATPATPQQSMNWQFPQYSQTWAFTPPTPPPYNLPPPFNASSSSKSGSDSNSSSSGGRQSSIISGNSDGYRKYGRGLGTSWDW